MTATDLRALLLRYRYAYTDEKRLQDGIESALFTNGVSFQREVRLSATDRPASMVGNIAVEVKVKGSHSDVLRQIQRYAQHDQVTGIVLVTSKACHRAMPNTLNGKPVVVASLMENFF